MEEENNKCIKEWFNLNSNGLFRRQLPPCTLGNLYIGNALYLDVDLDISKKYEGIDSQRVSILKAMAKEIVYGNVQGSVAELGVYKGDFARIINSLFPHRTMYLFDTFEGFSQPDLAYDKNKKLSDHTATTTFKDTSVDLVLSKMPFRENCRIVKGVFPESINEEGADKYLFVFVSIDADLYLPIYEGLTYFYPRLVHKGYIFVHDFNNTHYSGARKAVEEFCTKENIGYVPVSDFNGSVIITK